jgi:hypothetical protein
MSHLILEIVVVWLVAILLGLPLFASMGLAAFAFVIGSNLSPTIVPQKMAQAMNSFPLVAAPLFILMEICSARRSSPTESCALRPLSSDRCAAATRTQASCRA